jgi:hypothetical protein
MHTSKPSFSSSCSKTVFTFTGYVLIIVFPETTEFLEVEVTLRLTVSQSVRLGAEPTSGLLTRYVGRLLSESCGLVSLSPDIIDSSYPSNGHCRYTASGSTTSTVALRVVRDDVKGTQCPGEWLSHPVPGGYKYVNFALQVGRVSDETVKYGYGFCATRTIEWLHCKLQTRPLVREDAPQKQDRKFQTATFRQEIISGRKSHKGARYQDILTDWPSVIKSLRTSSRKHGSCVYVLPWKRDTLSRNGSLLRFHDSGLRLSCHIYLCPFGFPIKNLHTFLFSPKRAKCPAISSSFILSLNLCLARSGSYEDPQYGILSILPISYTSYVHIYSVVPYSLMIQTYASLFMTEIKYKITGKIMRFLF